MFCSMSISNHNHIIKKINHIYCMQCSYGIYEMLEDRILCILTHKMKVKS